MRLAVVAAVVLALAGCEKVAVADEHRPRMPTLDQMRVDAAFNAVTVVRDEKRAVTCWVFSEYQRGGISCLPDWMMTSGKRATEVAPEVRQ